MRSCAPASIAAFAPRPVRPTGAGRRTRQPARPHLPDQGHAGERPRPRSGDGHPYRPLPVLPRVHDDLPLGRALHASDRPRPRLCRTALPPAVGRTGLLRWILSRVCPIRGGSGWRCWGPRWHGRSGLIPDARLRAMLAWRRGMPAVSRNDDPQTFARSRAENARGADDRLRAEGAEHRHQRCDHPAAARLGCEVVVPKGRAAAAR
jgi:hypothetical protein